MSVRSERQKRRNGALYRNLLQNRKIFIAICEDTAQYPSGLSGGWVSHQGLGKCFCVDNFLWADLDDENKKEIRSLYVNLNTGVYTLRFENGDKTSGDFFNFRAMLKNCTREVAIAQIQELYNKLQGQDWEKVRALEDEKE